MPIRPFLAGQPFEPETIREMSLALESVCETLRLWLIDDPATRLVAQKIIELRQRGIRGDRLRVMTLQAFKYDDEWSHRAVFCRYCTQSGTICKRKYRANAPRPSFLACQCFSVRTSEEDQERRFEFLASKSPIECMERRECGGDVNRLARNFHGLYDPRHRRSCDPPLVAIW